MEKDELEKARKRAEELRREIERHNRLYYEEARPEIPDDRYDALVRELRELEERFPSLRTPDSPTRRVGGRPAGRFPTVRHEVPMLSLDNTYNEDELFAFDERVTRLLGTKDHPYVVEPKVDGVALTLLYRNGGLEYAATRGDGRTGDVITENALRVKGVPRRLRPPFPPVLEVRGEVYIERKDFARINSEREQEGKEVFANPRNLAAGTLKLLDPSAVAARSLRMVCYALGRHEGDVPRTQWELLAFLKRLGFAVPPHAERCGSMNEVLAFIRRFDAVRRGLPFDVDGVVVKVDRFDQREKLGQTSKAPRWMIAYKYEPERAETRVVGIEHSVGRTGVVTPVAELEPVPLSGSTVKRASLHNYEELARKDVRVGDRVLVEKAGEIIPQIVEVLRNERPPDARPVRPPENCPVCGTPLVKREGEVALRCPNRACPAKVEGRILHFVSRDCMDIDGLGPALVRKLVQAGLLRSLADIYRLPNRAAEIAALEGMGEKSAANLAEAIERSKGRGLERLLAALGIPNVGSHTAELLAARFRDIRALMKAKREELESIDEVGPVVAESVLSYFADEASEREIAELEALGVSVRSTARTAPASRPLEGKTVVVTGRLEGMSRKEAEEWLKSLGARVSSSVSSKTDYLLAGEEPGSKLEKARKLGVKTVTLDEMKRIAGEGPPEGR